MINHKKSTSQIKIGENETKVAIPLKHLSNSGRVLNIPLIN